MTAPQTAPYGSWKSPISSDLIVAGSISLGQIGLDGDDIYWLERRPVEGGRNVLVRRSPDGSTTDLTPAPFNVRTRVHEYGGGAYVVKDRVTYFCNFADQRLYRLQPDQAPRPLTPEVAMRYADFQVDRDRRRLICVREDHTEAGREAVNTIAAVDLEQEGAGAVLVSGNDFYAAPRLSPDGRWLAWLTWHHPNMPWDTAELWVGEVQADGSVGDAARVAGGGDESALQPEWGPDGTLYFVSDRTGWWNLYRRREERVEPLCERQAEFGYPHWTFAGASYAVESPQRIVCTYTERGVWYLAMLDLHSGELQTADLPHTDLGGLRARPGEVLLAAGSPTESPLALRWWPDTGKHEVLRRSSDITMDAGYLSPPEPVEFPTEGGLTAHAFYYPPRNRDFQAPAGEQPPLLVMSHGGPTGASSSTLSWETQYWTSRGIAVLDVNYGGSTGYGREYRQRLYGHWGIVDVDDCVNGARYLVEQGLADGDRLAITGGSAGGYTTLCALTFRDVFKAGASHFGVSDLEALARDTHKFESRYLDQLIGPYAGNEALYRERSPIHSTARLSCPLIVFQGLEDEIVPPNQAEQIVDALRAKGLPVAYLPFAGEQHGFRRAENIKRALDGEFYFYSRIFGFRPADDLEPVAIENLPD